VRAEAARSGTAGEQVVDERDGPSDSVQGRTNDPSLMTVSGQWTAAIGRDPLDRGDVCARVHVAEHGALHERRGALLVAQPVQSLELLADRSDPPRLLRMRSGIMGHRRRMVEEQG